MVEGATGTTPSSNEVDPAIATVDTTEVAAVAPLPVVDQKEQEPTTDAGSTPTNSTTELPFGLDVEYLQSLVCGAIEPFMNPPTIEEKEPPPPAGFWNPIKEETKEEQKEGKVLRNSSLMAEEDLIHYTSAGESVKTLFQTFEYGVKRNPRAPCLGKRKSEMSLYTWKTYSQIQSEAEKIGMYLKNLGIIPGQRVGLSGKNSPEYLTAIQGCFWAGATTVPIYDTFGEEECQYILKEAEIQVVFVGKENLTKMSSWTKTILTVKQLIVWGTDNDDASGIPPEMADMAISYQNCIKASSNPDPIISSPPKPDDLAIIMYTSGTTGMPKGVMLPHSALVATIASMERYFVLVGTPLTEDDVFMSYLPLAHVFDFFCECFFLYRGAKIGYYRGDQKTLVDDIGALKPTIFVGVPRVFERIYKRVSAMMDEGLPVKKMLFQFFFDRKLAELNKGTKFDQASLVGDALVFAKIKERLGGRVRLICSGGAPLPQHLEDWLKVTMCCPIVQGYGLTETCAASCVSMPDRADQRGTVGPPLFSTECKLAPVPDMGYDGTPQGGGEICFRGPSIMTGYYQKPDITAEVLTTDGWFHTGDIGQVGMNGCVKIVDRKKQLFKLSQGEYVSPEKVEGIAGKSQLVGQIWVHGTSTESFLLAVIVPSEAAFQKHGGKEVAVNSKDLELAVLEDLEKVCRAEKLKGYEIPKAVIFHKEEWTPESGFVTPSFKLKRPTLQKHFADEIHSLYATFHQTTLQS